MIYLNACTCYLDSTRSCYKRWSDCPYNSMSSHRIDAGMVLLVEDLGSLDCLSNGEFEIGGGVVCRSSGVSGGGVVCLSSIDMRCGALFACWVLDPRPDDSLGGGRCQRWSIEDNTDERVGWVGHTTMVYILALAQVYLGAKNREKSAKSKYLQLNAYVRKCTHTRNVQR